MHKKEKTSLPCDNEVFFSMLDLGFRLYFFDLKDDAQQRRQHLWAIQYDHLHNGPPFSVYSR